MASGITNFFPLFMRGPETGYIANSIALYLNSTAIAGPQGSIPLYLANSGIYNTIPLFIQGAQITLGGMVPSEGTIPLAQSIALYIERNLPGAITLYIGSNYASGGIPLYMYGGTTGPASGIPLAMPYVYSSGINSINLYTHGF